jgi:hypothetical protein
MASEMKLRRCGEHDQKRPGLRDIQGLFRDISGVICDFDGAVPGKSDAWLGEQRRTTAAPDRAAHR